MWRHNLAKDIYWCIDLGEARGCFTNTVVITSLPQIDIPKRFGGAELV